MAKLDAKWHEARSKLGQISTAVRADFPVGNDGSCSQTRISAKFGHTTIVFKSGKPREGKFGHHSFGIDCTAVVCSDYRFL